MPATLSLIIPAYNEEARLAPFLTSITQFVGKFPDLLTEIIVVDDGSTDHTAQVVQTFTSRLPRLSLIKLAANTGKGAAIWAGIEVAAGDYIVFMDADGATPIEEIPKMITALSRADIAVGSRWQKNSAAQRSSFFRHIAGWTYRNYMRLFGLGDIDTMCGFKGYRREVARDLFRNLKEKRWLFDTEVAYKSIIRGYTTHTFPIVWESKEGSKLSGLTLLKTAFQIWPLIRKIKKQEVRSNAN